MSFDTYYRLEIQQPGEQKSAQTGLEIKGTDIRREILEYLKRLVPPTSFAEMYYLQKIFEGDGILQGADSEAIKFDFCLLSEIYPDYTFILYGDADDTSIWVAYFRNGKEAGGEGRYVYPELPEGW